MKAELGRKLPLSGSLPGFAMIVLCQDNPDLPFHFHASFVPFNDLVTFVPSSQIECGPLVLSCF